MLGFLPHGVAIGSFLPTCFKCASEQDVLIEFVVESERSAPGFTLSCVCITRVRIGKQKISLRGSLAALLCRATEPATVATPAPRPPSPPRMSWLGYTGMLAHRAQIEDVHVDDDSNARACSPSANLDTRPLLRAHPSIPPGGARLRIQASLLCRIKHSRKVCARSRRAHPTDTDAFCWFF